MKTRERIYAELQLIENKSIALQRYIDHLHLWSSNKAVELHNKYFEEGQMLWYAVPLRERAIVDRIFGVERSNNNIREDI